MSRRSEKTTKAKKLIALRPILFRGRQYKTGEQLPADDAKMVAAWIEYKSAKWDGEEKKQEKAKELVAPAQPDKQDEDNSDKKLQEENPKE